VVDPTPPDYYVLAKRISRFFPQFHQSLVPAAVVKVERVMKGIFVIVLVIIFCEKKSSLATGKKNTYLIISDPICICSFHPTKLSPHPRKRSRDRTTVTRSVGINFATLLSHTASFLFAGMPVSKARYLMAAVIVDIF
jgi:hypothetical protein